MSNFLVRNKGKPKREKQHHVDLTAEYLNPDKLKQKFTEKTKVTWNECDCLHYVRAALCRRRASALLYGSAEIDVILTLFYLPESAKVGVVAFEFGQSIEVGLFRPIEDIREITNGDAPTDVGLIFSDFSESVWKACSRADRDEFVWIISQLSKRMTGLSILVSEYTPEIDLKAAGYDSKFPALFRLLSNETIVSLQGDEEKDAELLLEQLDWIKPVPYLQSQLHDDIINLNIEICDLLLQWEDDESILATSSALHSSTRVRDTVELLTTLNHVEKELGFVNDWLGNQINHLSQVQAEIKQIESESGTLETSLQNLTSVKNLIVSLTQNLNLTQSDEDILARAEQNLKFLMGSVSLSTDEVDRVVDPILSSLSNIRSALATNEDSLLGINYSKEDWDHLKLVSGIMEQRQKLNSVAFTFCSSAGDYLCTIFSAILRHKALNDNAKQESLLVRKFSFSVSQVEVLVCSGRVPSTLPLENRIELMQRKNQLLSVQRRYHKSLVSFLQLLEHTVYLNPILKFRIRKAYVEATQQLLYGPLLRQIFKELVPLTAQQHIVCMSTMPRVKANLDGIHGSNLQRFREIELSSSLPGKVPNVNGSMSLHVWDTLLLVILNICPVISREELFFQALIPDVHAAGGEDLEETLYYIDIMFSVLREKIIKIISSPEHVNGMEILATLIFVESVLRYNSLRNQPNGQSTSLEDVINVGVYTFPTVLQVPRFVSSVLDEAKDMLLIRLDQFIADEITWIQSGKGGTADAKMLGIFPSFQKFPILLDIVEDLTGAQSYAFAEKMLIAIGAQLLNWLYASAATSEKYENAILIQNLTFFEVCLSARSGSNYYPVLAALLEETGKKLFESELRYLDWMIAYEMPAFSNLFKKIEGVEKRANRDELSLYIRRQDVIKVLSGLDAKSVEVSLAVMRKRLGKHFCSNEVAELDLIKKLWMALEKRVHFMFLSIDEIVRASYQLSISIRPDALCAICDKLK